VSLPKHRRTSPHIWRCTLETPLPAVELFLSSVCLFCGVTIEFPCAESRLAEDLFLYKSIAHGVFPPFLEIVAQNIPYRVEYID